jgi:hypothetical protein
MHALTQPTSLGSNCHTAASIDATISLAAHVACTSRVQSAINGTRHALPAPQPVTHPALLLLCAGGSNGVFSHQAVLALAGLVSAAVGSYKNWNT